MLHLQFAMLALATTMFAASGCGSSKQAPTSSTGSKTIATATSSVGTTTAPLATGKPLTRAQLIAQGDAICATATRKLTAVAARSEPELVRLLPQAAINLETEAKGLSRLVPPASMTHDWTQIINKIHFASEYVTRVTQYIKEKQEKTAGQLYEKAGYLYKQSKAIAKRDGFKRCSRVT